MSTVLCRGVGTSRRLPRPARSRASASRRRSSGASRRVARHKSIGARDRRGHLPTRRRRWSCLPPGMAATACREVPFAAALFAVRPRLRRIAEERYPTTQRFLRELSCGVAAGLCGRSREPCALGGRRAPAGHRRDSAASHGRHLRGGGRPRAFFRGLPARTLSLAGTFTVVPLALIGSPSSKPLLVFCCAHATLCLTVLILVVRGLQAPPRRRPRR